MKYALHASATLFAIAFFGLSLAPAAAASTFEVTGWLPYWRGATSTADVLPHLNELTEVDPFVFTLKSDGTIVDNGKLTDEPWASFIAAARASHVRVVPTIMSGSGDLLHDILSNSRRRVQLEKDIADLVKQNNFDGIDIDFEGKHADDKNYFSTFLKGLYQRMGNKFVMCTIESRTPIADRYYGTDVPADASIYANDLTQINKYCDRVRIMTYDQQGIDQQLASQAASSSQLYAPVADPAWVEKVINLMKQSISPSKILIGVPTYGYEYDVTAYANNQYVYDILWTFNPGYATQIAQQLGITPSRNSAGEMYFTYTPNTSSSTAPISGATANLAAAAANAYATQYNSHLDFRLVDWPDATSLQQKIDLAKRLGVRGVSIFKFDGGEDPQIWQTLQGIASQPLTTSSSGSSSSGSSSTGSLTRTLVVGSRGADVAKLQLMLNGDLGTSLPGTTTFGPATLAAVKQFQVKYGIAKAGSAGYGVVGPATRAKLNSLQ